MRLVLDLSLPADARLVAATRKVMAVYLHEFGAPVGIVEDIILAMDEACSNVVQHAYPRDGDGDGSYLLRADFQREQILIEVVDEGVGFDIMDQPRHPEGRAEDGHLATDGRGFDVMRQLMSTVEVESPTPTGGTRLRLVRLLPPFGE